MLLSDILSTDPIHNVSRGTFDDFEAIIRRSRSELEAKMIACMQCVSEDFHEFYPYQQEVLKDIDELLKDKDPVIKQIAVAGANGIGKTILLASLVTYLMYFGYKDNSIRIVCLSGKYEQLLRVLFTVIKQNLMTLDDYDSKGKPTEGSILNILSDKIYRRDELDVSCVAESWDSSQPEKIKGTHAWGADGKGLVVVILDECTAIPDVIIENIRTTVAGNKGLLLAVANPQLKNNPFYRFFSSDFTKALNVSIFDLPQYRQNDFKHYIDMIEGTYGRDSHQYKTQILGQFSDESTLSFFPTSWIEESLSRTNTKTSYEPFFIGVDVAGGSSKGDFSVIVVRQDDRIVEIYKAHESIPDFRTTVIHYIEKYANHINAFERIYPVVGIDAQGLGCQLSQELKLIRNYKIISVKGSESVSEEGLLNQRILFYTRFRKWLQFGCMGNFRYIPPQGKDFAFTDLGSTNLNTVKQELKNTMLEVFMEPTYRHGESTGVFKLGEKTMMHRHSPDILDALSYTFVTDNVKVIKQQNIMVRNFDMNLSNTGLYGGH
jgi:hypothetical protein